MFISATILFIVLWGSWSIWSKLCDIEQKLFRMHDEINSSLSQIERDIGLLETVVDRIDDNTDNNIDRFM